MASELKRAFKIFGASAGYLIYMFLGIFCLYLAVNKLTGGGNFPLWLSLPLAFFWFTGIIMAICYAGGAFERRP